MKLGPYEIVAAIGEGGMGEVYRAKDTSEAKTISTLNHPHICVLYDAGHQDGVDYLVMEYIEGETLAQRLREGPLPLEQVLKS